MTFNEKLLSLRRKSGFSQEELAEKLGVSRQAVSRWEMGETMPDAQNILMLSDIFGVSTDYLLRDKTETEKVAENIPSKSPKIPTQKSPALYEILCSLPLFLLCAAADISLAAMIVCFFCTLLTNFSRVFTVKTVPFSHLGKSMRDRIFLAYILSSAFLLLCAAVEYFALPASGKANRVILLTLFVQIYTIVHAETFIYFPGDNSPVLGAFRRKFYSICPYFSAFPIAALCARAASLFGGDETTVLCITFFALLVFCGIATFVLKRKEDSENAK